jgi:hypothetical protein
VTIRRLLLAAVLVSCAFIPQSAPAEQLCLTGGGDGLLPFNVPRICVPIP